MADDQRDVIELARHAVARRHAAVIGRETSG